MLDPENMLAMLYTWQVGDCSAQEPYNGDFRAAMQGIKAKALVLPAKTDLYFRMLLVHREYSEANKMQLRRTQRLRLKTCEKALDNASLFRRYGVIGPVVLVRAPQMQSGWTCRWPTSSLRTEHFRCDRSERHYISPKRSFSSFSCCNSKSNDSQLLA